MSILISERFEIEGFEVELSIVDCECGMTSFSDKWKYDTDGLIKSKSNGHFTCDWYTVGQLNKGFDVTVYQAQKEFDRDCEAFDVVLVAKVLKNDIELINEILIGADYNYDDCELSELLRLLKDENLDLECLICEAKKIIKGLIK